MNPTKICMPKIPMRNSDLPHHTHNRHLHPFVTQIAVHDVDQDGKLGEAFSVRLLPFDAGVGSWKCAMFDVPCFMFFMSVVSDVGL